MAKYYSIDEVLELVRQEYPSVRISNLLLWQETLSIIPINKAYSVSDVVKFVACAGYSLEVND